MEINESKCHSTESGTITFLGQEFARNDPISLGEKLCKKFNDTIKIIDEAPITIHQKYILVRSIALPRVNYGPLVEQGSDLIMRK